MSACTNIISTFAGNGTAGYKGDNKPASSAALYDPYGVWGTTGGTIFIADFSNNRIRRVDASGITPQEIMDLLHQLPFGVLSILREIPSGKYIYR